LYEFFQGPIDAILHQIFLESCGAFDPGIKIINGKNVLKIIKQDYNTKINYSE